ncbi:MAG: recombination protein RecR [Gemmatimonadales bacterium]|nr:recombination protein RecR [Gemmatimonadales bacterium]
MSVIEDLITELARLPGIGRKTAQRLTYHLLRQPTDRAVHLAEGLQSVAERVAPCPEWGTPTEHERCGYCSDPKRDDGLLCVVEEPSGVEVVERSTEFRGRYHVLGGHLSPLDGVGPDALRLEPLVRRVQGGGVREVILATNPSMEGEATATYIQQLLTGERVKVTRLARGLPMGGDLEYIDGVTLSHALLAREEVGR